MKLNFDTCWTSRLDFIPPMMTFQLGICWHMQGIAQKIIQDWRHKKNPRWRVDVRMAIKLQKLNSSSTAGPHHKQNRKCNLPSEFSPGAFHNQPSLPLIVLFVTAVQPLSLSSVTLESELTMCLLLELFSRFKFSKRNVSFNQNSRLETTSQLN